MNREKPTFSIIMPIYNEEQFISEALDSILAQTDSDWEAVLVDDGSKDQTPQILDDYARRDPRFRVFHKPNGGQSTAINKGVQEARGEWLCWLSGDDYFHPKKLELNRQWITSYPECHFFFSGCQFVYSDRRELEYLIPWLDLSDEDMRLVNLFRTNYLSGISICIKRESWLENQGFDEKLRYAHDLDMWMRLMLTQRTHYEPDITCYMRFHAGQESNMFPLGCQFDASKAIIRLINAHSFKELVPFVNLNKNGKAEDVLRKAIDIVAGEMDGNLLYGLGVHPSLQLRMLEWAWSQVPEPETARALQDIIRNRSKALAEKHNKTPFGLLWKAVSAATSVPSARFEYASIDPVDVGRKNYYQQNISNVSVAEPLQTYLNRYDGVTMEADVPPMPARRELVLLVPPDLSLDDAGSPGLEAILSICRGLEKRAMDTLLVGRAHQTLGFLKGNLFLGAEDKHEINRLLDGLNSFDCILELSEGQSVGWDLTRPVDQVSFNKSNVDSSLVVDEILKRMMGREQKPPRISFVQKIMNVLKIKN